MKNHPDILVKKYLRNPSRSTSAIPYALYHMPARSFVWTLFLLTLTNICQMACQPSQTQARAVENNSPHPSKDSLMATLRILRKMTIVYPHGNEAMRAWAEEQSSSNRYLEISVLDDLQLSDSTLIDSLYQTPLFLIGRMDQHVLLQAWKDYLPLQATPTGLRFQDKDYQKLQHSLLLSWYPNPENPSMPIAILTSNSDAALMDALTQQSARGRMGLPWSGWDYQVFDGAQRVLLGNYTEKWQPDPAARWEFSHDTKAAWEDPLLSIYAEAQPDPQFVNELVDSLHARRLRWESWLEKPTSDIHIHYHLYDHPEQMGLKVNEMETGFRKGSTIHRLVHPAFLKQDPGLEWEIWQEESLGKASREIFKDGLRVVMNPSFQRVGYQSLAASLLRAEGKVLPRTMLDPVAYQQESMLVRDLYAGVWVAFLLEFWGKEAFVAQYKSLTATTEDEALATAWDQYQDALMTTAKPGEIRQAEISYHRGMTFAHEGYQVYNGYGSRQAEQSLAHLAELGCNAISIVPYTGTGNPQSIEPLRWSRGAGSENDASVILSHHATQALGMKTMLKPQVWVRGGWPGDVNMANEAEWEVWFDQYHRWIRHYALLAEIHNMDILCLGTEFRYATLKHPERWRDLVHKIRHIYRGTITYAANWGEEIENLGFADALDFVGVNFYYPLSSLDLPTDEEMTSTMEKHLRDLDAQSAKWGKPYVLTEIGFRNIIAPWKTPHAAAQNAGVSEKDQARCYQIVLESLQNHPQCRGLYWWKWPSDLSYPRRNLTCFTPFQRQAEEILRSYYQSW